mgnify:CR=1 FL=1
MNDAGSTQHQDSTMRITTHGLAGSQGRDGAPVPVSVLCWREACAEDTHTPNRTSSGGCVPYGLGGATAPRADHAFVALTTYMGSPCEMRALRALSKLRRVPMKPPGDGGGGFKSDRSSQSTGRVQPHGEGEPLGTLHLPSQQP